MAMSASCRVTFLLSLVSFVAYLVRADVAVAQERMAPALGLTMAAVLTVPVEDAPVASPA